MWAAIIEFVLGLFGFIPKGPSSDEKLGQAEQANADLKTGNVSVVDALAASAASNRVSTNDPSSLRLPDPGSRD